MARSRRFHRALTPWRKRPGPSTASLGLEPLETRYNLSGNVDVDTLGANVFFRGDDMANAVEVSVSSGNILVTGTDGTTINGSAGPFTLQTGSTQIDGSVFVHLLDGDDKFVIKGGMQINRNLHLFSGHGNDDLGFENASVLGTAIILTNSGNDRVVLRSLSIGENLILNLGDGDDTLNTQSISVGDNFLGSTGNGQDAIVLEQTTINDRLALRTGSENDTISIVGSTIRDDLTLKTGVSDDFVSIQSTSIGEHLKVVSSDDNDAVVLGGNTSIGSFLMDFAGEGNDALQVASSVSIGQSKRIQVLVESNTVPDALVTQRLDDPQTGANTRAAQARTAVGFPPPTPLQLTISTTGNTTVNSNGTLLTKDGSFTITGNTLAGARVEIARDGDSVFNDGTATADPSGNFTIDVTLSHTNQNRGENPIVVRSTDSFGRTAMQSAHVHFVTGTVVRMSTNIDADPELENIDIELLDTAAPTFVANFRAYFARYVNSIVHRLTRQNTAGIGVIQGGGFVVSGTNVTSIVADPDIDNNYNPTNPNIRGSIAMARLGDEGNEDTATSQWFINTVDNTIPLGPQTVPDPLEGFTVFGHVIPSSLQFVDAISAISDFDISLLTGVAALGETPLRNYTPFPVNVTGTVATTAGSTTVTGTGTTFTTQIPEGSLIQIGSQTFKVAVIVSDTQLTLTTASSVTQTSASARADVPLISTQYVVISSVAEVIFP